LSPDRRETLGQGGIRIGFRFLLWLMQWTGLCRFDLSALDALDAEPSLVIAANHPSLLDAVLVTARLRRTVCISKAALWNNPFLGGGIRLAGYLRNDSPLALIRAGTASLVRCRHLLVFPEGTRTDPGTPVRHFRAGFALMAKAAGVPVQTILIETDNPYLCKGWPLWRMPPLPIVYSIRVGQRFTVQGDAKHFVSDLEQYFRAELDPAAPTPVPHLSTATLGTGRLHQPA
jgi:1-acyl-sn-glycerol-3-phosphate acyltransferase